jgi:hypothetical protein
VADSLRVLDTTEVGDWSRLKMGDRLDLESGRTAPSGSSRMRDVGLVGAGTVFGWLTSKTWSDPGCQLGLVVFLVATALMTLGFALAVVGHGRNPGAGDNGDNGDHS